MSGSAQTVRILEFGALVFVPIVVAMVALRMQLAAIRWAAAAGVLTTAAGVGAVATGTDGLRAYLTGIHLVSAPVLAAAAGAVLGSGVVRGPVRLVLIALCAVAAVAGHVLAPTGLPSWLGGSLSGAPQGIVVLVLVPFAVGALAGRALRARVTGLLVVLAVGGAMTVVGQSTVLHVVH